LLVAGAVVETLAADQAVLPQPVGAGVETMAVVAPVPVALVVVVVVVDHVDEVVEVVEVE
jgi:alpha/beta superfamily hydrolase